jgi:hypothetical protein
LAAVDDCELGSLAITSARLGASAVDQDEIGTRARGASIAETAAEDQQASKLSLGERKGGTSAWPPSKLIGLVVVARAGPVQRTDGEPLGGFVRS